MAATTQTLEIPEPLNSFLGQISFKPIPPNPSMLKSHSDTFFWVQASILERFGETEQDILDEAFEKFRYFEKHHPKDFPDKMQLIQQMRDHWLYEESADLALKNVVNRFWNQNLENEYRRWIQKKYPEVFRELYINKKTDQQPQKSAGSIAHKKAKWLLESPEKFFDRHYPSWPFARLYRLVKTNNYHDSGVKDCFVLKLAQEELARQAKVSLRTISRFFTTSKRHGICLKIYKEVLPFTDLKTKTGDQDGLCAIWVFAKNMKKSQRFLRNFRSERPHLKKLLSPLRQNKTS